MDIKSQLQIVFQRITTDHRDKTNISATAAQTILLVLYGGTAREALGLSVNKQLKSRSDRRSYQAYYVDNTARATNERAL